LLIALPGRIPADYTNADKMKSRESFLLLKIQVIKPGLGISEIKIERICVFY
jgi:hypothetical protein